MMNLSLCVKNRKQSNDEKFVNLFFSHRKLCEKNICQSLCENAIYYMNKNLCEKIEQIERHLVEKYRTRKKSVEFLVWKNRITKKISRRKYRTRNTSIKFLDHREKEEYFRDILRLKINIS